MIQSIKIEGLFNKFNYDIKLKEEGLTILTGPNGYGKTTILKVLYSIASRQLYSIQNGRWQNTYTGKLIIR
ncbi:MAG: AAA family ATPase [Leptospiraceae bacterium]|nr:AAA family ATPase [Leptospiraceae bacterium]MCP5494588.1 AAA family ATPase [Leptospiraceae bacterium]